jgi:hypothetical protein
MMLALKARLQHWQIRIWALPKPARILLAGVTLLVVWVVLKALFALLAYGVSGKQALDASTPRSARLLGLIAVEAPMAEQLVQIESRLGELALPDTGDTGQGGAALQQTLRRFADEAGLAVQGSQVLEPRLLEGFERVQVQLTLTGVPQALDDFLLQVQGASPVLFVESLELMAPNLNRRTRGQAQTGGDEAAYQLAITLTVSALRLANTGGIGQGGAG